MKTFKKYILEQSQSAIAKPLMTQYNPVYSFNQQQYNPNRGASPLPKQNPTMASIQGGTATVAKILDPSGVLSWEDIPPTVDAYNKQPTPANALFVILALIAVIPVAGKFAIPLKAAARAGKVAEVKNLITPAVTTILKHPEVLAKTNLNAQAITKMKNEIITNFNPEKWMQAGGTIGRSNKATIEGMLGLLNHIGIPVSGQITQTELTRVLMQPANQEKLYHFLKNNPIEIKRFPELYNEIKDGNHRYELARIAGIKNIPATFK